MISKLVFLGKVILHSLCQITNMWKLFLFSIHLKQFTISPKTSRSKSLSATPASFVAIQLYLPVSVTSALLISSWRPSVKTRILPLVAVTSSGLPFFSHSTLGLGMPVTKQLMVTVRLTITVGLVLVLASASILGGTRRKQNHSVCLLLANWYGPALKLEVNILFWGAVGQNNLPEANYFLQICI